MRCDEMRLELSHPTIATRTHSHTHTTYSTYHNQSTSPPCRICDSVTSNQTENNENSTTNPPTRVLLIVGDQPEQW